jgi:hypothetical protein
LLSEIERIITAHGLVEFRGTLSMLLDRMEAAAFEAGVFGRASSGKSSLLNHILQTNVLPIGVTPVTAIPTRISHGPVAEAVIEFAEAQPQIIPLSELPGFATEQKNPGNKKHSYRSLTPRRRKLQPRCLILTTRMRDQFFPKRSLACWPNL